MLCKLFGWGEFITLPVKGCLLTVYDAQVERGFEVLTRDGKLRQQESLCQKTAWKIEANETGTGGGKGGQINNN